MKLKAIYKIVFASLLIGVWSLVPLSTVNAKEIIRYCCSNQIYESFEKDKIERFTQDTGIEVHVNTAPSMACVYRLGVGHCEVASTARKLYRRHQVYGYTEIPFSKDPMAVIVKKECKVENLTEKQLQDVFAGEIANWKELGGADLPIMIIVPGKDTAAHKNFRRQIMKREDIAHDFMAYNSTMVIEAMKHFPCGSVSFISQGAALHHPELTTLKIDGRHPTDKDYPYFQIFYYVTKDEPSGNLKKFIDYTFSEEGAKLIRKYGMIPLSR